MKDGNNERILDRYKYLSEDSLYRDNTHDFTKRTITPVMASLAELIRSTPGYEQHYDWFIELAKNFHDIQMDMVKPKNDFAVICHGKSKLRFSVVSILFLFDLQFTIFKHKKFPFR